MTDKEIEEKAIKNIESIDKNNIKYPFVCRCDMTNNADEECRECKVNAYCGNNLSCEKAKELYNKAIDDAIKTVKAYFCEAIDNGADVFSKEDKDMLTYNKHINERLRLLKCKEV